MTRKQKQQAQDWEWFQEDYFYSAEEILSQQQSYFDFKWELEVFADQMCLSTDNAFDLIVFWDVAYPEYLSL
jgi:hypothetical protein